MMDDLTLTAEMATTTMTTTTAGETDDTPLRKTKNKRGIYLVIFLF